MYGSSNQIWMVRSAIQATLHSTLGVSTSNTHTLRIFLILYNQCLMDFYEQRTLFHRARLIQWGRRTRFSNPIPRIWFVTPHPYKPVS